MSTVWRVDAPTRAATAFRHEALLYAGPEQFRDATTSFIREGLRADEQILVMAPADKIDLIRSGLIRSDLGGHDTRLSFTDIAEVGRNPGRIIPVWREFITRNAVAGRRVRGIGEAVWGDPNAAELAECQRHESLLNVAFAGDGEMTLLCPYDLDALDTDVIDAARASHPLVAAGGRHTVSRAYTGVDGWRVGATQPLAEPPPYHEEFVFDLRRLRALRSFVVERATGFGLADDRAAELVLAVDELATNSVQHGGGGGMLRIWRDGDALVCEIRDTGRIDDPLVGRVHPPLDGEEGRGLWLVNQLCDLVECRTSDAGTAIRLHVRRC
jgi:anti-sigma regulatory factor (Ser/Thr protein kinase)